MSDLAKRIDTHSNTGLLVQQWQQAPRMRALVDALQGVMDDHLVKPLGRWRNVSASTSLKGSGWTLLGNG